MLHDNQLRQEWGDKPYFGLSTYLKEKYGQKVYKIALDGGFTCPNRDGKIGTGGCIFCSAGGSGEFAAKGRLSCKDTDPQEVKSDVDAQIADALTRFGDKKIGQKYIAYFQAYTGTYADKDRLLSLYEAALCHPDILGISIATRPDCLGEDVLSVLRLCQLHFPDKFIWIELGLQTIHPKTAAYIRRGYPLSCFEEALQKLQALSIPVIVHVILGLPGETSADLLKTIQYLNGCPIFGIKLQLLHVLKDTDLARDFADGTFAALTKEEYLNLLIMCIEHLSPDIVIHRVTGDGPKQLLIEPRWSLNKRDVLNSLHQKMRTAGSFQGKYYSFKKESL